MSFVSTEHFIVDKDISKAAKEKVRGRRRGGAVATDSSLDKPGQWVRSACTGRATLESSFIGIQDSRLVLEATEPSTLQVTPVDSGAGCVPYPVEKRQECINIHIPLVWSSGQGLCLCLSLDCHVLQPKCLDSVRLVHLYQDKVTWRDQLDNLRHE